MTVFRWCAGLFHVRCGASVLQLYKYECVRIVCVGTLKPPPWRITNRRNEIQGPNEFPAKIIITIRSRAAFASLEGEWTRWITTIKPHGTKDLDVSPRATVLADHSSSFPLSQTSFSQDFLYSSYLNPLFHLLVRLVYKKGYDDLTNLTTHRTSITQLSNLSIDLVIL